MAELARRLGGEVRRHERFATATVRARRPRGRPGGDAQRDLPSSRRAPGGSPGAARRRPRPPRLHRQRDGGAAGRPSGADRSPRRASRTCERGQLRVLHPGSFADDPTRALRAARYAARYGFTLEPQTAELCAAHGPLDGLARPQGRRAAKARRGARGRPGVRAARGVGRCWSWSPTPWRWLAAVGELAAAEPWRRSSPRADAVLAAALGRGVGEARELASAEPARPSEAVELARGSNRGRAGARPGAGCRVARPLRRGVATGPARDRRRRPDRSRGSRRARRSGAASLRRCGRSSTGRSMAARRSFARRLPRRAKISRR